MRLKKTAAALAVVMLGGTSIAMVGSARAAGEDPPKASQDSQKVSQSDKQFLNDSYSINEGEIMLGRLAGQRGTTRRVTTFAQQMVSDHTKGLATSKRIASEVHVTLPAAVDAPTKALYDDLSKKSGRDFDAAYLDAMVSGHEAAVNEFEQEASSGENATVKGYARDELPMLREHLRLARTAQQDEQKGTAEPQKPDQQKP